MYIHFFDVLPLTPSHSSFILQVEVPPLVPSGALVKEVVAAQPFAALGVEKKIGRASCRERVCT